ncbi:hypothetical protein ON010_g6467 [Phytophthora cinnamomi]|nr:hypothetical protein ON010_g6467 [Phytophthora cinnamomi]
MLAKCPKATSDGSGVVNDGGQAGRGPASRGRALGRLAQDQEAAGRRAVRHDLGAGLPAAGRAANPPAGGLRGAAGPHAGQRQRLLPAARLPQARDHQDGRAAALRGPARLLGRRLPRRRRGREGELPQEAHPGEQDPRHEELQPERAQAPAERQGGHARGRQDAAAAAQGAAGGAHAQGAAQTAATATTAQECRGGGPRERQRRRRKCSAAQGIADYQQQHAQDGEDERLAGGVRALPRRGQLAQAAVLAEAAQRLGGGGVAA